MKADEWHIYEQRFPAIKTSRIFLAIDEYAYMARPATLKSSLAYSMVLNEMLRHTDFLKMAAFTTGASTMDITPTGAALNATGEVFRLYGEHFGTGTVPLGIQGNSPQPAQRFLVGFAHKQARAGSPTYPLDVVAGLSPDGKNLRIAVVNATYEPQRFKVTLANLATRGPGRQWLLTGQSVRAENKVGAAPGVTIVERKVKPLGRELDVPAISTSIFEFPLARSIDVSRRTAPR
jgi:alpha-N-arabinofuranosidase